MLHTAAAAADEHLLKSKHLLFAARMCASSSGSKCRLFSHRGTPTTVCSAHLLLTVAEDNRINQKVLRMMLQASCAELTVVSDGQQAVDAFTKADPPPDALILDVHMPNVSYNIQHYTCHCGCAQPPELCTVSPLIVHSVIAHHTQGVDMHSNRTR
eukprot:6567-Heterococcus_DN1.PRE.10